MLSLAAKSAFEPTDHVWSHCLSECVVTLASQCGAECELTLSYSEDLSHASGRFVSARISDVCGDPDGAAWLDQRAEELLAAWRDREIACRNAVGGVWC